MNSQKRVFELVSIILIIVGIAFFLVKILQVKPIPTHIETIQDSILYHAQQEKIHIDSARIHHEAWEKAWERYRDTSDINSSHWDTLRANYKRALEEKIRTGITGFSDTVRGSETGRLSPAHGKPSFVKSKSGTAYPDGF